MDNIKNKEDSSAPSNEPNNINSDYNKRMSMDNHPDPSAKRNIGLNGETERRGQKDKLANMHIKGNETTGYGANDPNSVENLAQGPGFEFEGSDTGMDDSVSGIRSGDQLFGDDQKKPNDADQSRI